MLSWRNTKKWLIRSLVVSFILLIWLCTVTELKKKFHYQPIDIGSHKIVRTSVRLLGAGGEFTQTTARRTDVNRREKKVRLISLYHIWSLRMETRRLGTEMGRRMGVARRFIYNLRDTVCHQHNVTVPPTLKTPHYTGKIKYDYFQRAFNVQLIN